MKQIYLLLTALFLFSCSITPLDKDEQELVLSGINCWDTNGNRINDPSEDINNDGLFNAFDCRGNDGADGEDGEDGISVGFIVDGLCTTYFNYIESNGIAGWQNGEVIERGTEVTVCVRNGEDGEDGNDGSDGEDGKCFMLIEKVITLEEFSAGDIIDSVGVIKVDARRSNFEGNQFMIFDSENPTGKDFDLEVNSGKIGIISEDNDSSDPDDNARGGVYTFEFDSPVTFQSIDIIDIENTHNFITIIYEDGTQERIELTPVGNKAIGTFNFSRTNVIAVHVAYCESGALDNLRYKSKEQVECH